MKPTIFEEIHSDYTDDNGVMHLDGYKFNEDEGQVVAYIFNKDVYYTDPEFRNDSLVIDTLDALRVSGHII